MSGQTQLSRPAFYSKAAMYTVAVSEERMRIVRRVRMLFPLFAFLSTSLLATQASQESDGPDQTLMAPVTALASYMARTDRAVMPSVFVDDGLVIVENFAPYIFVGKDASARWNAAIQHHVERLKDLKFDFGVAHDFDRTGSRVYFVLPTTWRGIYPAGVELGKPYPEGRFEEHGAWSFVLDNSSGQWRIISYTWGVTDETDTPTAPAGKAAATIGDNEADAILAADAAWLKVYEAKDLDKSVAFCDKQGSMLVPNAPIATGKDAIAKAIASDFRNDHITWHANKVGVAHSADLGYTSGTYENTFKDASGKTASDKGKYLTVWKKEADGAWKVLYDMFNSDLPATP
jgi:ketosteroid isomerase-like protein